MGLTDDTKARALNMGADLVGIAPVDRFEHAPEGGKPQYYMPDAKCAVVIATRVLQGICEVHGSYEREGTYGINYHALGEFGLNRLLLTPKFGPRVRLISIVTNAPLDPDPMYNGPKLCRREECEDLCVKACPLKAFEDKLVSVKIGDRVFEYAALNSERCQWHSVAGKYLRGSKELPRYPTQEYLDGIIQGSDKSKELEKMNPYDRGLFMHAWGAACGDCSIRCPAPWK